MKRKLYLLALLLSASLVNAQQNHDHGRCLTDQMYQQQIHDDPSTLQRAAEFERQYREYLKVNANTQMKAGEKIIIPVVFHVFHIGGKENISREQIQDQIDTMNVRYNKVDFSKLRPIFWGVAATCEIEFRLATKDPNGNCTDGIVRIYDPETENGTNNIKSKSAWPTDKYLNIWVVKDINSNASTLGTTLGYAQFPWFGSSLTDGIVVRHDNVGSIGTGANPDVGGPQQGSTLVHEAGHWLGLYHPFQDSCFGGDGIDDTPPVMAPNFGCNKNTNSCTNDFPDLPDMIENYMDYADGPCMALFTIQQKHRMHMSLKNWRPKLISQSNLEATGVADPYIRGNCGPHAYFFSKNADICYDGSVTFINNSYNFSGSGVTYEWEFEGGTPSTSTAMNPPAVKYSVEGYHKVKLTARKTINGTDYVDSFVRNEYVRVFPQLANYGAGFTEGFEFPVFPINGWTTRSTTSQTFKRTSIETGSIEGNYALVVNNNTIESGALFYLESPTFDLSAIASPVLSFSYAFAQRKVNGVGTNDGFIVSVSTDCGVTWRPTKVFSALGTQLATNGTAPFVTVSFVPSGPNQWKTVNIPLTASMLPVADRKNARFRFEFVSRGGNNFYLDQINIGFNTGIQSHFTNEGNFSVYPNPTSGNAKVAINMVEEGNVKVEVLDMFGRQVAIINDGTLSQGSHELDFVTEGKNLSNGMYMIRMTVDGNTYTRKLLLAGSN